ncbi:glycoside hydrolase family 28 protein [Mucilaginibacter sp. AW1-3]
MQKALFLLLVAVTLTFESTTAKAIDAEPEWAKLAGAHDIPYKKTVFKVSAYGAINDGLTLNTKAIQKAIDACSSKGGGIVIFDPGKYLTGSLFLKENVRLEIGAGTEILGSERIEDYPEIDTRIAGIEMKWPAALINVINKGSVAITGQGIINGQGKPFWNKYDDVRKEYEAKGLLWAVDYDAKRPRTLLVSESTNITIRGITIQQAGFYAVQVLYSKFVTIDGVILRNNIDGQGPGTDGVDIDSSSYVLVQNCDVDCNNDNFCLKAGRDADGLRVNRPTEYIVIRNSVTRAGAGILTIGSETSGSIRHVLATNLVGNGTANGLNIKSAETCGGTVEDIHFQNITMNSVDTAIQITMNWNPSRNYSKLPGGYTSNIPAHWKKLLTKVEPDKGIPRFQDVYISNVNAMGAKKAINAEGMKEGALRDFHFNNITISAAAAGSISFASNWIFDKVNITAQDASKVSVKDSQRIEL